MGAATAYVAHNLNLIARRITSVSYNSRAVGAALVGAALGGFVGYLFFTAEGRQLRRRMEPALDELAHELSGFRSTMHKAVGVASEGWRLLNEAMGEAPSASRYVSPHQTSPF
jgi:hypothetical protein